MNRSRVALGALMLASCGYPSSLDGFVRNDSWKCGKYKVEAETSHIDHEKVCRNIKLAESIIQDQNTTSLRLENTWGTWRIRIWNRQVLFCDQKVLGACVHILKGMEEGDSLGPIVNVNNGGELLLHEFLHAMEPYSNPDHKQWPERKWTGMDWWFRQKVEML